VEGKFFSGSAKGGRLAPYAPLRELDVLPSSPPSMFLRVKTCGSNVRETKVPHGHRTGPWGAGVAPMFWQNCAKSETVCRDG